MCGIAGIVGKKVSQNVLNAALKAIVHRGPDSTNIYQRGSVGLVHSRLSIIDLSVAASQPMTDANTGVTIVFNGEIYNFRDLRRELEEKYFNSNSDTEVVLRLYLKYGLDAIERLRGMFALAIWDPRSRSLHLARDRFGIKPLYFFLTNKVLCFASEAKALHELGCPRQFNQNIIADYIRTGRMAQGEESFFENVKSLPAGMVATFRNGTFTTATYWSTDKLVEPTTDSERKNPEDIETEIWKCLVEAVDSHLISDVPIGVSLSSGLDSQILMHILKHLGHQDLHTFTFGFEEQEYDEVRRLDEIGFSSSVTRHTRIIRPGEMLQQLEQAVSYYEAPLGGLGSLAAFMLMELPQQKGIPVLLSGEGADEIFGGYKYYYDPFFRDLYENGEYERLQSELLAYAKIMDEPPMTIEDNIFKSRIFADGSVLKAPDGSQLESRDFLSERAANFAATTLTYIPKADSHLRAAMLRDLCAQKLPKLLLFQDRASMARGVETRVPFLDHHLVEKVYQLSSKWIIRYGEAKFLAKRLLNRFCGIKHKQPTKHFVAVPQREWLKGPLFKSANEYLDDGLLAQSGLIDYQKFKSAYADYAESSELENSFFVWKMLNIEAFMRAFSISPTSLRLNNKGQYS